MEDRMVLTSLRISQLQLDSVDALGKQLDRDRSWILRDLIRRGLDAIQAESDGAESEINSKLSIIGGKTS